MSDAVEVTVLPKCDFCAVTAAYDSKTKMGPWANMCPTHFVQFSSGLGTGKGQRLILKKG